MQRFRPVLSLVYALIFASAAKAHEVSVDNPFSPQEEIAGIDAPPYALQSFYEGEVRGLFGRSNCYVPRDKLQTYSIGEWLEQADPAERARLVCAILMLSQGPQAIIDTDAREPNADFVNNVVLTVGLLAATYRAPYNLSAVEAISATVVVLGGMSATDQRALTRAILE